MTEAAEENCPLGLPRAQNRFEHGGDGHRPSGRAGRPSESNSAPHIAGKGDGRVLRLQLHAEAGGCQPETLHCGAGSEMIVYAHWGMLGKQGEVCRAP